MTGSAAGERKGPGKFAASLLRRRAVERVCAVLPVAAAMALVPVVLIPVLPERAFHWDEFQLAYGVERFDLTRHRPHPPGYYLFIVLGRLLLPLVGDALTALRLVSVAATSAIVGVLVASLPRALAPSARWTTALAIALFATLSPLLFAYGVLALSYASEAACWLLLLIWIGRRPTGWRLYLLAFAIGLAGGLRQTLCLWGATVVAIQMLSDRRWIRWRELPALGLCAGLGFACWLVPLLVEAGGVWAYQEASRGIMAGNVWSKSVFVSGLAILPPRLAAMLVSLWEATRLVGLAGLCMLATRLMRPHRDALAPLDALWIGAALSFAFYALLIYDTPGYLVAPAAALAGYAFLGAAALVRGRTLRTQRTAAAALLLCAVAMALAPASDHSRSLLQQQDREVAARVRAIRGAFDPETSVLLTSPRYWNWGLRHVGHELPEFTALQLYVDRFFAITTDESLYLTMRGRKIWTSGPDGLDLATLTPASPRSRSLTHVVYASPHDVERFLDASCAGLTTALRTWGDEQFAVIAVRPGITVRVVESKVRCQRAH